MLAIWIHSFVWAILPLIGWNSYNLDHQGIACTFNLSLGPSDPHTYYILVVMVVACFTPLLLVLYSYSRICCNVCSHERAFVRKATASFRAGFKASSKLRRRGSVDVRVAQVSSLTVLLYCLCWLPFTVTIIVQAFGAPVPVIVRLIVVIAAQLAVIVNPILYAYSHPYFRIRLHNRANSFRSRANSVISQSSQEIINLQLAVK